MKKIDIKKAEYEMNKFIENYDITNKKIKLKADHTFRTADVARQISSKLKLDNEDIDLAWLIGLLHDIGRFEQLRVYDTFDDSKSIDHADFGVKLLFENRLIERFIEDRSYDDIIYKAIKNHNKYKIEEGLDDKELLHAKIIRDADKTDIYEVVMRYIDGEKGDDFLFDKQNINKIIATNQVIEEFQSHKLVSKLHRKNDVDLIIGYISYIYDYNFKESLEIVKKRDYINRLINILEGCNETKKQTDLIRKTALEYLNEGEE